MDPPGHRFGKMPRRKLTDLAEWQALKAHFERVKDLHLRDLFQQDPKRAERFWIEDCGLVLDYSKNRITTETIDLLVALAESPEIGLGEMIGALFTGQPINRTEERLYCILP